MKRTGTINWPVRRLSMARIVASKKTIWFQWRLDFSIIRKFFGFLELVECFFINSSSSYPNHNHLSSYCLTTKASSLSEEEAPSLIVGLSPSRSTSYSLLSLFLYWTNIIFFFQILKLFYILFFLHWIPLDHHIPA